ncbi:MAG: hypothetical protein ACI9IL_000038 [Rickettsiales bacterium]|jgi:hypothetical protein
MFLFGSEDGETDDHNDGAFPAEDRGSAEGGSFDDVGPPGDTRSESSDDSENRAGGARNARASTARNARASTARNPNHNTQNATHPSGPIKSAKPSTDIDISHYPEIDGFKYQLENSNGNKEFKIIAIREGVIEALRKGIKISNAEPKNFIQDKDLIDSFNYIIKIHPEVIDENSFQNFLEKELEQTNNPFQEIATSYEFKKTFEKRIDSNSISSNVEQVLKEVAKEIGMVLKCVPTSMEDLIKIGGEINDDVKKWLENLRKIGASESEALGSTVYIAGVWLPTAAVAGAEGVGILICLVGAAAPLIIGIAALGLATSQFAEYIRDKMERTPETDMAVERVTEDNKLNPALDAAIMEAKKSGLVEGLKKPADSKTDPTTCQQPVVERGDGVREF